MTTDKIAKPIYSKEQQRVQAQEKESDSGDTVSKLQAGETRPVEEKPQEVREDKSPDVTVLHPLDNATFHSLANFLGIEENRQNNKTAKRLTRILEWAQQKTQSNDEVEILAKIKELEQELPSAGHGDRRENILFRYVVLMEERDKLDTKIKLYQKQND